MKIIFLDIDDVVNSDRLIASCMDFDEETSPPIKIPVHGDPVVVNLINRACAVCGAKVVVCSTWLDAVGWDYTRAWLVRCGLDEGHLHETPMVTFSWDGAKRTAILGWRKKYPDVPTECICVVDDDPHLFPRQDPLRLRQVVVDGPDGLLLKHYKAIIQKCGRR